MLCAKVDFWRGLNSIDAFPRIAATILRYIVIYCAAIFIRSDNCVLGNFVSYLRHTFLCKGTFMWAGAKHETSSAKRARHERGTRGHGPRRVSPRSTRSCIGCLLGLVLAA